MTSSTPRCRKSISLLASALGLPLLLASAPAPAAEAAAGCRYVRVGEMPVHWVGSRLRVEGSIDGTPEPMIIDTGATHLMIPQVVADDLALAKVARMKAQSFGAGGVTRTTVVTVAQIQVGDVKSEHVKLAVNENMAGVDILVGADFLFEHDLEINGAVATSFAPLDCADAPLAYWAPDVPFVPIETPEERDDPRVVISVRINGQPLRALVDTGAPSTLLDIAAARRLGLGQAVADTQAREVGGVGRHRMQQWPLSIAEFAIGDELVQHPRIQVADLWGNARKDMSFMESWRNLRHAPEMLLGADFLKVHRLLFAVKQRRFYFSYLGGAIFDTPTQPWPAAPAEPGASATAGT